MAPSSFRSMSTRAAHTTMRLVPTSFLVWLNGHPRLKRSLRSMRRRPQHPPGTVVSCTVERGPAKGATMALDLGTSERNMADGTYEPWFNQRLSQQLTDGMDFWDVGAHVGYYLVCASLLSPSGSHLGVEADVRNRERLAENLRRNRCGNVQVVEAAVSSHAGSVAFSTAADGILSRISDAGSPVDAVTMDALAERHGMPDLVMMDIEGGEVDALRSAGSLLEHGHITWYMELHGAAGLAAHDLLEAAGFTPVTPVTGEPPQVRLESEGRAHAIYRTSG